MVLVSGLLASCGTDAPVAGGGIADAAPDFAFVTVDGRAIARGDLAGKPVVLNFWASRCGPCRQEMTLLERAARACSGRDVGFLGRSARDDADSARTFLGEVGVTCPNGLGDGSASAGRYGVVGLPVTVFIGRDGTVVRRWNGGLGEQQLGGFGDDIAR